MTVCFEVRRLKSISMGSLQDEFSVTETPSEKDESAFICSDSQLETLEATGANYLIMTRGRGNGRWRCLVRWLEKRTVCISTSVMLLEEMTSLQEL